MVNHRYQVAGDFTGYLLGRFGAATYVRLYSSLLALSDTLTIRRAFAEATGASLDQVIADWRAHDPVPADGVPGLLSSQRCAGTEVAASSPGRFAVAEEIDCLTKLVSGYGSMYQPVRYAVELEAGLHAVRFSGLPDDLSLTATLQGCDATVPAVSLVGTERPRYVAVDLPAGRHIMQVIHSDLVPAPDPSAQVDWIIERLGQESADCAGAPVWAAAETDWTFLYDRPAADWPGRIVDPELGEVAAAWVRLDAPATPGTWWVAWSAIIAARSGSRVNICSGSCQALTCSELPRDLDRSSLAPTPGAPVWLEMLTPVNASSAPVYIERESAP